MFGKTINLFLVDGDVNGRWICEIANWSGIAYKIPREYVEQGKTREELSTTGVYFLCGFDAEGNRSLYVGETEDINTRFKQHLDNYSFWTEAIALTSKDENLNKAHIKYLENTFYNKARLCGAYKIQNGAVPTKSALSESDRAWLDEFVYYAVMVVSICGHKAFEKETVINRFKLYGVEPAKMERRHAKLSPSLESITSKLEVEIKTEDNDAEIIDIFDESEIEQKSYKKSEVDVLGEIDDGETPMNGCEVNETGDDTPYGDLPFENFTSICGKDVSDESEIIKEAVMRRSGIVAYVAIKKDNKMVIKAGSQIKPLTGATVPKNSVAIIEEAVANGSLVNGYAVKDIEVSSLSQASTICLGILATGSGAWKTEDGVVL